MTPKISIIVPIYNTGEVLRSTVESILNQTYKDFELVLIDDGSKDISSDICDEYQKKDNRVKVFHKANSGICDTRNYGVSLACGKYIAFCDHDDLFAPTFLESLLYVAEKYHVDVVKCGWETDDRQKNIKTNRSLCYEETCISGEKLHASFLHLLGLKAFETIWNGLYRLEALKAHCIFYDTRFRHGGEDFDFNLRMFSCIWSVALIPDILYIHVIRPTLSTSSGLYDDILTNFVTQAQQIDIMTRTYELLSGANGKRNTQEYIYVQACQFVSYISYSIKKKKKYFEIKHDLDFFSNNASLHIGSLAKILFSKQIFANEKGYVAVLMLFRCFGQKLFYYIVKSVKSYFRRSILNA